MRKIQSQFRNKIQRIHWTPQQKQVLISVYKQYPNNWNKILTYLPHRTVQSCIYMTEKLNIRVQDSLKRVRNKFTKQQDSVIITIYKKHPEDWDRIATYLTNRSAVSIKARYKYLHEFNFNKIHRNWTFNEDQLFLKAVYILQFSWSDIARIFENCNQSCCYQRYRLLTSSIDRNDLRIWSQQQDTKLLGLFQKLKENWQQISKQLQKRSPQHCLKGFYKLKSQYLQYQWTQDQIDKLVKKYYQQNGDWSQIIRGFQKYTLRDCYFRYYQYKHRKILEENPKIQQLIKKVKTKSNNSHWNFKEDDLLLKLVHEHQFDWQLISNLFENTRSSDECSKRFFILQYIYKNKNERIWRMEQDKQLIYKFEQSPFDWEKISNGFIKCTKYQCYTRFQQLMDRNHEFKKKIYKKYCQKNNQIKQQQLKDKQYKQDNQDKQYNQDNQDKQDQQDELNEKFEATILKNMLIQLEMLIKIGDTKD